MHVVFSAAMSQRLLAGRASMHPHMSRAPGTHLNISHELALDRASNVLLLASFKCGCDAVMDEAASLGGVMIHASRREHAGLSVTGRDALLADGVTCTWSWPIHTKQGLDMHW